MTEYTAPVENLIKVIDNLNSCLHRQRNLLVGSVFCLTWLVGTSRHEACAPVRSECTYPSKLITPAHMIVLINNHLKKTDYHVALWYFHLFLQADSPYKTI